MIKHPKIEIADVGATQDGRLKVDTDLNVNIESVTATDVTIRDSVEDTNKLTVNADGSINVSVSEADIDLSDLLDGIAGENTLEDLYDKIVSIETEVKAIKDTSGIKKIDETVNVKAVGSVLAEHKTHDDADEDGVIEFSEDILAVEIYHNEAEWQTFEINGIEVVAHAGGYRTLVGGTPANTVTIPEGIECIVGRLI